MPATNATVEMGGGAYRRCRRAYGRPRLSAGCLSLVKNRRSERCRQVRIPVFRKKLQRMCAGRRRKWPSEAFPSAFHSPNCSISTSVFMSQDTRVSCIPVVWVSAGVTIPRRMLSEPERYLLSFRSVEKSIGRGPLVIRLHVAGSSFRLRPRPRRAACGKFRRTFAEPVWSRHRSWL